MTTRRSLFGSLAALAAVPLALLATKRADAGIGPSASAPTPHGEKVAGWVIRPARFASYYQIGWVYRFDGYGAMQVLAVEDGPLPDICQVQVLPV